MDDNPIAQWFRYCLAATAVFNFMGAISFIPPVYTRTAVAIGVPENSLSFSLWVLASWIFIFGIGYLWLVFNPKPERLFIAVAAACKLAIALFFFIFWMVGDLPLFSIFAGLGDVVFAIILIKWLLQTRSVY